MNQLSIKITGERPLLMHADTLANPLSQLTKAHKELTSTRKKSDETQLAIAKSEFLCGCYFHKSSGFYMPAQNLDACIVAAAKLQKLGVKFKQAVQVAEDKLSLIGNFPKTPADLWENPDHVDVRGVKVGQAKIMRYRPVFQEWALEATVLFNEEILSIGDVKRAVMDAGQLIGLGDYRPRFGRFSVEFL